MIYSIFKLCCNYSIDNIVLTLRCVQYFRKVLLLIIIEKGVTKIFREMCDCVFVTTDYGTIILEYVYYVAWVY